LPEGDDDYPNRWRLIKGKFSRYYLMAGGIAGERNQSRRKKREAAVWQRRYWEHTIRDDTDFAMHFNYIHFNPVKHGLVTRATRLERVKLSSLFKIRLLPGGPGL